MRPSHSFPETLGVSSDPVSDILEKQGRIADVEYVVELLDVVDALLPHLAADYLSSLGSNYAFQLVLWIVDQKSRVRGRKR